MHGWLANIMLVLALIIVCTSIKPGSVVVAINSLIFSYYQSSYIGKHQILCTHFNPIASSKLYPLFCWHCTDSTLLALN